MQPSRAFLQIQPFRKLRLTTKDINKGYYKGTRTGSMGRHTKRGGYILEMTKVRTYVVPAGLSACKVGQAYSSPPAGWAAVGAMLTRDSRTAHTIRLGQDPTRAWRLHRSARPERPTKPTAVFGAMEIPERGRLMGGRGVDDW